MLLMLKDRIEYGGNTLNKVEVCNSISLKKKFCKDCNLPIMIFDNPYFLQRLNTLDKLYNCNSKWETFCESLVPFNSEQSFFEHYNSVKEAAINSIKSIKEYHIFINGEYKCDTIFTKQNLYTEVNDGKTFISLDMKKANFSAMRYYSPEIFQNCETWEEFISKFTYNEHIINSKYIRQVILGACNPKKQIQYERFLMNELLKKLFVSHDFTNKYSFTVYALNEDEIVLQCYANEEECVNEIREILKTTDYESFIDLKLFTLHKIPGVSGYIKKFIYPENEKVSFKCCDASTINQLILYYTSQEITDDDLVFYHNGMLAKYLKPIDNPRRKHNGVQSQNR